MLPSLPSPAARGGAAQVAGPATPPPSSGYLGGPSRPIPSRHAALPGWSGPSTGSGSEGPSWGGRAMAAPAATPLLCPLLLSVCCLATAGTAAGRSGKGLREGAAGSGAAALRVLLRRGGRSGLSPCAARTCLRAHHSRDVRENAFVL